MSHDSDESKVYSLNISAGIVKAEYLTGRAYTYSSVTYRTWSFCLYFHSLHNLYIVAKILYVKPIWGHSGGTGSRRRWEVSGTAFSPNE